MTSRLTIGEFSRATHLSIKTLRRIGRVAPLELPAVDLAIAVHTGGSAEIDITYGGLGEWVAERELAVDGPVHERYLVRSRDSADASHWRTEIGWQIAASPTNEVPDNQRP